MSLAPEEGSLRKSNNLYYSVLKAIAIVFTGVLYANNCYSQVCSGNLGDPVVNIDFGKGASVGPQLTAGITDYIYDTSKCPDDGMYTIANSTGSCFTNTWHTVSSDHTPGDTNGYMMIINASHQPGIFYRQTVSGLCPNTTYEFAAWIINILKSLQSGQLNPNLTFTIETTGGALLKTYNTGTIDAMSSPEWFQYGFLFRTTNITDVVLTIKNNAPGGVGNDLILDDITFRPCGPTITPKATTNGKASATVCFGETMPLSLEAEVAPFYDSPSYQWQVNNNDGTGWIDLSGLTSESATAIISNAAATGYQYRLSVAEGPSIDFSKCRVYSTAVIIDVIPGPTADAGPDKSTIQLQPVRLDGKATGSNLTYLWTPSTYLDNPAVLNPVAQPEQDITYTLQVISADGCLKTAIDEMNVRVYKKITVNNTFTPNGDGINDTWNVAALDSYTASVTAVYNRYGEIVFSSKGYENAWDGTYKGLPVPTGVYNYVIDLQNNGPRISGWVLVLR